MTGNVRSLIALAALAAATSPAAAQTQQQDGFIDAMQLYERSHWNEAFDALGVLADAGHPEAARIAHMMVRFGSQLYGASYQAPPARLSRWLQVVERRSAPSSEARTETR